MWFYTFLHSDEGNKQKKINNKLLFFLVYLKSTLYWKTFLWIKLFKQIYVSSGNAAKVSRLLNTTFSQAHEIKMMQTKSEGIFLLFQKHWNKRRHFFPIWVECCVN